MATFFLIIIYMAFISLGLPDSLLGSAWPVMQGQLGASIDTAGAISMAIAGCTIFSSLFSGVVIQRFGTGLVTLVSVALTAGALLGFSHSPSVFWLILCSIPLGLGAGAVDAGLNSYVAAHYKAHHMSWLHCFWGVGATLGPIIMARYIDAGNAWRDGYLAISGIQGALVLLLFLTLPLWRKVHATAGHPVENERVPAQEAGGAESPVKRKGLKWSLMSFLFYCGAEATVGLWGSSYLVHVKDMDAAAAAQWVSLYYAGITVGRFITGFVTFKVSNKTLIRTGQWFAVAGALLVLLPLPAPLLLTGFIMIGLGLAPIFPCMLHETPVRFGQERSQKIMGYQMALAYTGSTLLPPLLGWLAAQTTIGIFPFFVAGYILFMLAASERINAMMASFRKTLQPERVSEKVS
ncbi:MFS transporter [Cohnella candidum]|uniref:MFS transporter n=1 Tax=Cohnella candidum TaxID=2674991 RepID=A0A3G3JYM1_9BACL|nr:MFS transporter [Cohnella candidum]AYQ73350.1 MFS transporter [Cohnella candidum]